MNANRQLGIVTTNNAKSSEKLSSGYKINRAADDAAGLSISEKMRSQIRGLDQGSENIQEGISACQIMDGAINELHDMTHRMTELAVKAANGTLSSDDRRAIQQEIDELKKEFNRTVVTAEFNTHKLLYPEKAAFGAGGQADIVFLVDNTGSMGTPIDNVKNNLNKFCGITKDCNSRYSVIEYGEEKELKGKVHPFVTSEDDFKAQLDGINVGGGGDGPESALEGIMTALKQPFRTGASKQIVLVTDADFHYKGDGTGASNLTTSEVANAIKASGAKVSLVGTSADKHKYINGGLINSSSFYDIYGNFAESLKSIADGIKQDIDEDDMYAPPNLWIQMSNKAQDGVMIHTYDLRLKKIGLQDLSVLTEDEATASIDIIGDALEIISATRSQIGAEQNRLEHSYNNNQNKLENTTAAESRIRDTDMAEEMVEYSKNNILMQAGQSVLAQANQSTQGVLSLLQ